MVKKEDFKKVHVDTCGDILIALEAIEILKMVGFSRTDNLNLDKNIQEFPLVKICALDKIDLFHNSTAFDTINISIIQLKDMVNRYLNQSNSEDPYSILYDYLKYRGVNINDAHFWVERFKYYKEKEVTTPTIDDLKQAYAEKHNINIEDIKL